MCEPRRRVVIGIVKSEILIEPESRQEYQRVEVAIAESKEELVFVAALQAQVKRGWRGRDHAQRDRGGEADVFCQFQLQARLREIVRFQPADRGIGGIHGDARAQELPRRHGHKKFGAVKYDARIHRGEQQAHAILREGDVIGIEHLDRCRVQAIVEHLHASTHAHAQVADEPQVCGKGAREAAVADRPRLLRKYLRTHAHVKIGAIAEGRGHRGVRRRCCRHSLATAVGRQGIQDVFIDHPLAGVEALVTREIEAARCTRNAQPLLGDPRPQIPIGFDTCDRGIGEKRIEQVLAVAHALLGLHHDWQQH